MKLLAIDTSGPQCAAGIFDLPAQAPLAMRAEMIGKGHAEILPGMIEACMLEAGLTLKSLDRIAVTIGPGSFTGIRVGVAMARGLALSLGIPAVGVTTLSVVAEPHINAAREVLALIDARRDELYAQLFSEDGATLGEAMALQYDAARALARKSGALTVGSGASILNGETSPQIDPMPLAAIAAIGARLASDAAASPLYIRGADAKPQTGFAVQHA
jgi:N6-L-threonylcarbamoyladenine synthase